MECLASSVALTILLLAASAAARCPDPEAHSTIIMNVQDETAQQALTASVNVTSFVLTDFGEEYITLSWMPALLTEHAATSQVCTYMLTFNYLGVASSAGGPPPPTPPLLPQAAAAAAAAAAGLPRGQFSMHTVQYTNNTIATHHGLPPSTPVQVALHVCLLVNASTMVCVHVANTNATTSPLSGSSSPSRLSAPTTTSVAGVAYTTSSLPPQRQPPQPVATQPPTSATAATAGPAESEQAVVSSSSVRHTVSSAATSGGGVGGSDGSDGHVSSGMAGVAIVAATVIVLTAVGVAGASYLVYRHCRTRWEPLPSHFWTIELQAEYDSVSFTDGAGRADVAASSGGGSSSSGGRLHPSCVRPADGEDDGQRCRLLDGRHDGPYKLLTA